jgi:hypothetical protein
VLDAGLAYPISVAGTSMTAGTRSGIIPETLAKTLPDE